MELKLAPFDPFDHASPDGTTAVWLAAFEALEEPGPHGFLDFAKAGVLNFDESWFEVLKNTFDNLNPDLSSDSMEEINKEDLISKLTKSLNISIAYESKMMKEEYAMLWSSSFAKSMEGGTFFWNVGTTVTQSTFDHCYVAVLGSKMAYILIEDED